MNMNRHFRLHRLVFWSLYSIMVFGFLFPDVWWGIHFLSFLPGITGHALLISIAIINIPIISGRIAGQFIEWVDGFSLQDRWVQLSIAVCMALLYRNFPIVKDPYGEGFNYAPYLEQTVKEYPAHVHEWLFSISLKPAAGRQTMLGIYTLIAYYLEIDFGTVFRLTDALAGGLFIWLWSRFASHFIPNGGLQWLLLIAVATAPFGLAFFGHTDTYSVIYVLMLSWLMLFVHQSKSKHRLGFCLLTAYLVLLVKLHPLMVLLTPALFLSGMQQFFPENAFAKRLHSFRGVFVILGIPIFLAGSVLYFFVFKDYNDPRLLMGVKDFDRLFLPLLSPSPPLDRYNLLSINHFFDCLNMLLFWSPAIIFLAIMGLKPRNEQADGRKHTSVILLFTFALYTSFLFVINPLIAMPMDWDLFSFPAIVLLVLMVSIFSGPETSINVKLLVVPVISLAMASCTIFWVHANTEPLSYRIENVGKWIYRSYYEHSAKYIHFGIGLIPNDPELYLSRKQDVLHYLKPYAIEGNDVKYASMYTDNGIVRWRATHDHKAALADFEAARLYAPDYGVNLQQLMLIHQEIGNHLVAHSYSLKLLELNFPSEKEALLTAAKISLRARLYTQCRLYCSYYLKQFGEEQRVQDLLNELEASDPVD